MKRKDFSDKIVVRRIKTKDFTRLTEVLNTAFQREIAIVGLDSSRLQSFKKYHTLIEISYRIFDFFHKDYPTILVATLEDRVVGEVHVVPLGNGVWTIDSLATDPAYSGRGVGYELIKGSIEYATKKGGKKALSSIRTDNVPALKIAEELGFSPFQKTIVFFREIENTPEARFPIRLSMRRFQQADKAEVFGVCNAADHTKTQAYDMSPKNFQSSPLERLQNRMLRVHSEKFVLEVEGRIAGYAHVTYTSQYEAARIDLLNLLPTADNANLAEAMLNYILKFLSEKNIRKVLIGLDEKREKTIDILKQQGFRPLATFYEITRSLD